MSKDRAYRLYIYYPQIKPDSSVAFFHCNDTSYKDIFIPSIDVLSYRKLFDGYIKKNYPEKISVCYTPPYQDCVKRPTKRIDICYKEISIENN